MAVTNNSINLIEGLVGQIVQNTGTGFTNTTATYPSIATTTGTILRADGTNWVKSTATFSDTYTASNLLYSNGSNTVQGLATANNGLLVTNNTGIPSILAGPGTTGNILQSNAAVAPSFSTATYPSIATTTGTILRADGTNWVKSTSTFADTYAINTLLVNLSANTVTGLPTANNGILVTSAGGVPSISSTLPNAVLANVTKPTIQTFTTGTAATYTTPANVTYIRVRCWGGGGGGGFGNNIGHGGASGAYCESIITSPAGSYTYTVGGGGAGATSGAVTATAGSATTFSAGTMSAGGGGGSGSLGGTNVVGAGGTATGGNIVNIPGFSGGSAFNNVSTSSSGYGGGPGGAQGILGTAPGVGNSAVANSGGGGGGAVGTNTNNGGAGAAGYIVVEEHYV